MLLLPLLLLACIGRAADTTRRTAIMEGAQALAISYAKTNYPHLILEVPLTKRTQFNLFSLKQEIDIGERCFKQTFTNAAPIALMAAQKRVAAVGSRLAAASQSFTNAPALQFVFLLVDSKDFNAGCLPGGKVIVNSGVLSVVRDDDELSFVLAHEVAHALARHFGESQTREIVRQKGLKAASFIADWAERQKHIKAQTTEATLEWLNMGTALTTILPHLRAQEAEADHLGLIIMAKAGFNPHSAVALWQRIATAEPEADSAPSRAFAKYRNDHPPHADRVANLRGWMDEANGFFKRTSHVKPANATP